MTPSSRKPLPSFETSTKISTGVTNSLSDLDALSPIDKAKELEISDDSLESPNLSSDVLYSNRDCTALRLKSSAPSHGVPSSSSSTTPARVKSTSNRAIFKSFYM